MDPISVLFSAYINTFSETVHSHIQEVQNLEIKTVSIRYQDTDIQFQHQIWRVRDASVCASLRENLTVYSQCTVKAKSLFADLCTELGKRDNKDWRVTKHKNMYCNAAVEFKPTVASIAAGHEEDDLTKARQACNIATAEALGSSDSRLIDKRKVACDRYESLKK